MVQLQPPLPVDTDHYITTFDILLVKSSNNTNNSEPCYAYDFTRADNVSIFHYISNSILTCCFSYTDVESVEHYQVSYTHQVALDKYIPKYRIKSHKSPKWCTSDIRHLLNCVRSLLVKGIKTSNTKQF